MKFDGCKQSRGLILYLILYEINLNKTLLLTLLLKKYNIKYLTKQEDM